MANNNAYMREYMLARYHRRRDLWLAKLGGSCAECGGLSDLEFDHIEPKEKTFNIGRALTSASESKLAGEMRKCQLLCQNCHRDKTNSEQSVEHGGGLTGKKNCLCELCKPLKLRYNRNKRL